jgi:hypothetical protein
MKNSLTSRRQLRKQRNKEERKEDSCLCLYLRLHMCLHLRLQWHLHHLGVTNLITN